MESKYSPLQQESRFYALFYEGESVNRTQMDIKSKTCDIQI
jgi:hypothetical protein